MTIKRAKSFAVVVALIMTIVSIDSMSAQVTIEIPNFSIPKDKESRAAKTAELSYGMIYDKWSNGHDSWCRILYVNVVQDYAGGGT